MQNVTRNGIAFLSGFLVVTLLVWSQLPKDKKNIMVIEKPIIELYGEIPSETTYISKVHYRTTSKSFLCTRLSLFQRVSKHKVFEHQAIISNNRHHIKIPLDEKTVSGFCGWVASEIHICLNKKDDQTKECIGLFSNKRTSLLDRPLQIMDGKTIIITCDPFDLNSHGSCYSTINNDENFNEKRNYISNPRYKIATQKIKINFRFNSMAQAQQRIE